MPVKEPSPHDIGRQLAKYRRDRGLPQVQDQRITTIIKKLGDAVKQFALEFLQTLAIHLTQRN
ncbi:hypothetical protein IPC1598_00935 [Pseudomonas aeruginosa]|nr:hypothetical protein IPC1598_00935 [Pseudomonas aeruginosa]